MATIATLAAEYDMQPHELQAYADLNETDQLDELDDATEAFVRDLLDNSEDGTYTPAATATLNVEPRELVHGKGYEISVQNGDTEVLAPLSLAFAVGTDHAIAKEGAELALTTLGWTVTGDWEQYDSCYTVSVRRA